MPDQQKSTQPTPASPAPAPKRERPELSDDVAGKAYDSRLMRRLLTYLRPYKPQVAISCVASSVPAGPLTAAPPTIGLTAAMRARLSRSASRIPGTARMGAMLVTGLLGASSTRSAARIASITPGAGSASDAPANRTDSTGSWYHR